MDGEEWNKTGGGRSARGVGGRPMLARDSDPLPGHTWKPWQSGRSRKRRWWGGCRPRGGGETITIGHSGLELETLKPRNL